MSITSHKVTTRMRRHGRIRAKIAGTEACPRLAVFRSNRFMYAQLINDDASKTILGLDSRATTGKTAGDRARELGQKIAEEAKKKGITKIAFDRGGFQYKGAIAALAEGAREGGLIF
jgi:large subunit ribosomal protein L18